MTGSKTKYFNNEASLKLSKAKIAWSRVVDEKLSSEKLFSSFHPGARKY